MKRIQLLLMGVALSAVSGMAQVAWNLNIGSEGANLNVGTPTYIYMAPPVQYGVPANGYYYYGHGHKHNKHAKKARKYYRKAMKEARKANQHYYYAPAPRKQGHKH